ncbi:MAG: hypothetical protein DIU63_04565 [Proteobacteria bacterium]|jgi:hypothetical protein|nr:MAG: hypothetical protein DIU63_04565 [Pseudomonadota bacterium]
MRFIFRTIVGASALTVAAAPALAETKLVDTFNDWHFYSHNSASEQVCFAASTPKSTEPATAGQQPTYFYISAWPKDGVRTELSLKFGFPLKKGAEATVTVGNDTFKLFTNEDRGFINNPIEELKLLEAMKGGSTMVVEAVSEQGTVKHTFSLMGVTKAVQNLTSECK